jgi:hypothetical protein
MGKRCERFTQPYNIFFEVASLDAVESGVAHPFGCSRVIENSAQGGGESCDIANWEYEPFHSICEQIRLAADVIRQDDWEGGVHYLVDDESPGFVP